MIISSLLMVATLAFNGAAVIFLVLWSYDRIAKFVREQTTEYVAWLQQQLDLQFIEISATRASAIVVGSALGFALIGILLTIGQPFTPMGFAVRLVVIPFLALGPFGIPVGWSLPRYVVRVMWNQRVKKFDDEMMDALTLMSNALKSGLSLIQSMDMVVREMEGRPVSQEFSLVLRQQQLGMPFNDSLNKLEERMSTENTRIIVTAITILRETGGNLSETFDTIAYTIRERKKVEGKISALTAQGIMQGIIIFCMPFVLGVILYVMDPVLISRMWQTNVGLFFLALMLVFQGFGGWLMKKVVTIEV